MVIDGLGNGREYIPGMPLLSRFHGDTQSVQAKFIKILDHLKEKGKYQEALRLPESRAPPTGLQAGLLD